jgi:2'-5' RNA ligase
LWAGVSPHEPLKLLHNKVDQACLRVGVEPDHRAYLPHITLARLGRGAGRVAGLVEQSGGLTSEPFTVDAFCLFESELTPQGPIYTIVERYLPN